MWKRSITALALVLAVTSASAQDAVTTQRTTTVNTDGSRTETVTVDQYQTRLKEAYVSVGLPDTIVSRVLPLDVKIYNARVAGDVEKVKVLRQRQVEILTPEWVPKVRTYFTTKPYSVRIGSSPYTVWSDYVEVKGATDGSRTETVTVDQYQTRLKEAYVSAGLPDTIVSRVLPLDVEIYNARVAGDVEKIKVLRQRQVEILTPQWAPKVRTYFTTNPYVVRIGPSPYTVWSDYAVVN